MLHRDSQSNAAGRTPERRRKGRTLDKARLLALAVACAGAVSTPALADQESTAQWRQIKAEIDALKKQVGSLSTALSKAQQAGFGRQAPGRAATRTAQRTPALPGAPSPNPDAAAQSRVYTKAL